MAIFVMSWSTYLLHDCEELTITEFKKKDYILTWCVVFYEKQRSKILVCLCRFVFAMVSNCKLRT